MEDIAIYDNFFSKGIQKEIFDKLWFGAHWELSGANQDKPEIGWHYDNLEKQDYFSKYLWRMISSKLNGKFKVLRIYANGQTAGQCGSLHNDDGDFTFLYYPCLDWRHDWQGHLIFMDRNIAVNKIVEYRSNRAVIFNGKIPHYADAPSRFFNGLRISLAYKLKNV